MIYVAVRCRLKCMSLKVAEWQKLIMFFFKFFEKALWTIFDWILFGSHFKFLNPFNPLKSHAWAVSETSDICECWNNIFNRKVYSVLSPGSPGDFKYVFPFYKTWSYAVNSVHLLVGIIFSCCLERKTGWKWRVLYKSDLIVSVI